MHRFSGVHMGRLLVILLLQGVFFSGLGMAKEKKLDQAILSLLLDRQSLAAELVPFVEPEITGRIFYLDPVNGSLEGDGSKEKPWPAFAVIIDKIGQDKEISGGDALVLLSGYHGDITLNGKNMTSYLTVKAGPGQTPVFSKIAAKGGSHWYFKGLTFRKDIAGVEDNNTLFSALDHGWHGEASHFILHDCTLSTREDTSNWTAKDWSDKAASGISINADHSRIQGNHLKNVASGITIGGKDTVVANNTIDGFCHDGMRGNGHDLQFLYNVVMNTYDVDENHDDGFQSFIVEASSARAWERVTLRGNLFIGTTDPDRPLAGYLQGIGCFDGFYKDWVIENNIVIVDHYHGITLMGAENCRIVNNTVLANTLEEGVAGPPWIRISDHKDKRPSSNCIIANNIAHSFSAGEGVTLKNNYDIDDPKTEFTELFKDWPMQNVSLRNNSAVIDTADPEYAPKIDQQGVSRPQGKGFDIGALEYR